MADVTRQSLRCGGRRVDSRSIPIKHGGQSTSRKSTVPIARQCRPWERFREGLLSGFEPNQVVSYDELWIAALSFPLVWEADLKTWISAWASSGQLTVQGMKPRQRVPRRGDQDMLTWNDAKGEP